MKFLVILSIFFSKFAFSQQVTSHSKQNFSIYEGVEASLEVTTDQSPDKINWLLGEKVLSDSKTFKTPQNWNAGYYYVDLVISFKSKIISIPYFIHVFPVEERAEAKIKSVVVPLATFKDNFQVQLPGGANGISIGDYSKLTLESGEVLSVGKSNPVYLEGGLTVETTGKGAFFINKANQYNISFFQNTRALISTKSNGILVSPVKGSMLIKKNDVPISISLHDHTIDSLSEDAVISIIEGKNGSYVVTFLSGEGQLSVDENINSQRFRFGSGDGVEFGDKIRFSSMLKCFDENFMASLDNPLIGGCRKPNKRHTKIVDLINKNFDSYLELELVGRDVEIRYLDPENKMLPSGFRAKDGILNNTRKRTLAYPEDQEQIIDVAYKMLELGKISDLKKLYSFVDGIGSPILFELKGIIGLASGDCGTVESDFQLSSSAIYGRKFHYLSALALVECEDSYEAMYRFDDVRWWSSDEEIRDDSIANVDFYKRKFMTSSLHEASIGYSSNPSYTSQDTNGLLIAPEVVDAGGLFRYNYSLEKDFFEGNPNQSVVSVTKVDLNIPLADRQFSYNRLSISENPKLEIKKVTQDIPYLNILDLSGMLDLSYKINTLAGNLGSSEFNYRYGIIFDDLESRPSISFRRKLIEDGTDTAEFFDFAYGIGIATFENNNISAISKDYIFSIENCISIICKLQFEVNEISYHRTPSLDLSSSGFSFLAELRGDLMPYWDYNIGLQYKSFTFASEGDLSVVNLDGAVFWEFLPRQRMGAIFENSSVSSSLDFLNYSDMRFLLSYKINGL